MGWALGTEGLTPKRISENQWVTHCRKRQRQRREAEKNGAEEHATWGKSGTEGEEEEEEEAAAASASGYSGGSAQVRLSRGGALKEKREADLHLQGGATGQPLSQEAAWA